MRLDHRHYLLEESVVLHHQIGASCLLEDICKDAALHLGTSFLGTVNCLPRPILVVAMKLHHRGSTDGVVLQGFPGGSDGKENHLQGRRPSFDAWIRKTPWRRAWQPTPVFLPRESHGQRSLAGQSPWSPKESYTIEHLTLSLSTGQWT